MVAAISMVKDEADVIEHTVTRMLDQVDQVLVADNGSTDGTREILEQLPVTLLEDPDPAYYQSAKMSRLAERAASEGAEWIVPFDADEVWLSRRDERLADTLSALPGDVLIVEAALYDHVATATDHGADPITRMGWRRPEPGALPKVACRARGGVTIHQGNHGASFESVDHPPTIANLLVVHHFPYRSVEQFVSKARNGAAAYAAAELPEDVGAHWRSYGQLLESGGEEAIAEIFHKFFWREEPAEAIRIDGEYQPPLVFDPCP